MRNKKLVDWTPELVERVAKLWAEGHSTQRIAEMVGGGATKNTIIGKAHRMRWEQRRPSPRKLVAKPRRRHLKPSEVNVRPRPRKPKIVILPPEVTPPPPPPPRPSRLPIGSYTLLDLGQRECKFPVNSPPRGGTYLFCGEARQHGSVYCEHHHGVSFVGTRSKVPPKGWTPRTVGY